MNHILALSVALLSIFALIFSLVAVSFFGRCTIKYLIRITVKFPLPNFLIGFIVLGLGTSLPDIFVTSFAAYRENANLVLSSIIGANITLISLVLGIVTLVNGKLPIRNKTVLEDFGWIFFALIVPFLFLLNNTLSFIEGIVLIFSYLMFVYNIDIEKVKPIKKKASNRLYRDFMLLSIFLAGVLISAHFVVENALNLSQIFGISESYIGFTIIGLGIALPELSTVIPAIKNRKQGFVWGTIIGSFVTNLTLVLGIAALFGPLHFDFSTFQFGYAFMSLSFLLVFFFTRSDTAIDRGEAVALIFLYLIFLILGYQSLYSTVI